MNNCPYCKEFESRELIHNGETIKRILYETDNFVVFPALGCFIEGYLLIAPKQHYISVGTMPSSLVAEMEEIKNRVKNIITQEYGEPVVFEHGPSAQMLKGVCCIDHAHLHVVPFKMNLHAHVSDHFQGSEISGLDQLKSAGQKAYLFTEGDKQHVFLLDAAIPTQLIRKIIAKEAGITEKWDWRTYPEIENLKKTITNLKRKF
ncbi:MAG: hypothetical protein KKG59_05910 [Nanoarchaeota archaeon]|nr:hypothetical protein [Nanoarchaeota archaeon]